MKQTAKDLHDGLDLIKSNTLDGLPVLCISHGFQTNYERGFTNGLANNGANVTLICSDRTDKQGLHPSVCTVNLRGSQEENRPSWKKAVNMLQYHLKLLHYIVFKHPDLIHVIGLISPPLTYGIFEGIIFRLFSTRYVLTVHNILPHDRHTRLNRFLYGLAYRIPRSLVVHTRRMKEELGLSFNVSPERIVVMEHGIEPSTDMPAIESIIHENKDPVILIFGRIGPYKGVDLLIEALASANFKFKLVIAGVCLNGDYKQKLNSAIENHPFKDSIQWIDRFVDEQEMIDLFLMADLLALPYRHIDQSGVLFQALRFGLPIVATDVGQFSDYVTPDVGELARAGDVQDLTAAIHRWAGRRQFFSRKTIQEIGKKFEWQSTVLALGESYK